MRILYFTRGATVHDRRIVDALERRCFEVGYMALSGPMPPWIRRPLMCLDGARDAGTNELDACLDRVKTVVDSFNPQLVLAGPLHECGYLALEAATTQPVVLQSWAFDVLWNFERSDEVADRIRKTLKKGRNLFTDCTAVADRCADIRGDRMQSSFVMPWGLAEPNLYKSTEKFRSEMRRELGVSDEAYVFIHTRYLEPIYDPEFVLRAFAELAVRHARATLVLLGCGSLLQAMKSLATSLGVEKRVRFISDLEPARMPRLLAAADAYVSNSQSDGTSISLLEAMASGLPSLVNDIGGNAEWVRNGENGWLVPNRDRAAFVCAMESLYSISITQRQAMAVASKRRISEKADWDRNFDAFAEYLRSVEGKKS